MFADMVNEVRGCVPKLPISYCPTLVNRSWDKIRRSNLWSFNLYESSWSTPPLITTGTVTTTQGSPTIQFDAVAVAAINAAQIAQPYSLITQRQFRIGVNGIYSIIQYDQINGNATLDRIYGDISGTGQGYQIYQLYYPAPFLDHLVWLSVRNMQMFESLGLTTTRSTIDAWDPQRTWYQFPTRVVPYGRDIRGQGTLFQSATLGFPLYELWGQPVTPFTYQCYGIRQGSPLVNPTDTLPYQVGEDLVVAGARYYAYEWSEANKDMAPRNAGPDYKYLMREVNDGIYKDLLIRYRKQDKEFVDNWFSHRQLWLWPTSYGFYNTLSGTAGPYAQF